MQLDSKIGEGLPLFGARGSSIKIGAGTSTPDVALFDNPLARSPARYTADGRRIVDGHPETTFEPEDLWSSVVHAGIKKSLVNGHAEDVHDGKKITAKKSIVFTRQNGAAEKTQTCVERETTTVTKIDLNLEENSRLHHTDRFFTVKGKQEPQLVVRRGQEFKISISFAEDFQIHSSKVQTVFELGTLPCESHGSRATLTWEFNKEVKNCNGWSLQLCLTDGNVVDMVVKSPADLPIGQWSVKLRTVSTDSSTQLSDETISIGEIFLLYNPWTKNDSVFLETRSDIEEYVLQDVGPIWKGTQQSKQKVEWVFGQFEQVVLENSIFLLEKCGLALPLRSDPVLLCRGIARSINSKDSPGVLTGNFTNLFPRGSHPSSFTGSAPILNEFACYGRPVRYAQCWVFSGLMCTVMRCFGIPCRVVTNYNSVHDLVGTNANIHFSKETGNINRNYGSDMTWSFHVWNECWMSRPDLPEGYGGWQAVSATPQKKFEDVVRAGPAPVCAILDERSNFSYDTSLFRTEVTAEKRYWVVDEQKSESIFVGTEKNASVQITKSVGGQCFDDISSSYKQRGLSVNNRRSENPKFGSRFVKMLRRKSTDRILDVSSPPVKSEEIKGDIEAALDLTDSCVVIGEDIGLLLKVSNHSTTEDRNVDIHLRVGACLYTGAPGQNVLAVQQSLTLRPNEERQLTHKITESEYIEAMLDQGFFHVKFFGNVQETGQMLAKTDAFCLKMPEICMEVETASVPDDRKQVKLKFTNPTSLDLKECRFIVEGAGLTSVKSISLNNIGPRSETEATVDLRPWRSGNLTLVARFCSDRLVDVHGSCTVDIM